MFLWLPGAWQGSIILQEDHGLKFEGFGFIGMAPLPQLVPSSICLQCDVCCRFPDLDSFLRPYFTESEIRLAVSKGVDPSHFPNSGGGQVRVVPNPKGEGFLCPAFNSETFECRIYEVRPLDCQIYPFVVMWSENHREVLLGWDSKCPFMTTEGVHEGKTDLSSPAAGYASHMFDLLQNEKNLGVFESHPGLITPFQDDVIILGPLTKITPKVVFHG